MTVITLGFPSSLPLSFPPPSSPLWKWVGLGGGGGGLHRCYAWLMLSRTWPYNHAVSGRICRAPGSEAKESLEFLTFLHKPSRNKQYWAKKKNRRNIQINLSNSTTQHVGSKRTMAKHKFMCNPTNQDVKLRWEQALWLNMANTTKLIYFWEPWEFQTPHSTVWYN